MRLPTPWRRRCVFLALTLALVCVPVLGYADAPGTSIRQVLTDWGVGLADRPWGALVATLGYALAGVLFIPVNLLAAVALAVFGVWPGMAVAWMGGLMGATLSHSLGWRWGASAVARIPERARQRMLALAQRRAFWAVVLMRILPVGNFGAFNLLAGAFRLPRAAYVLGNMLGLLPALLGLGMIEDRLFAALRRPSVVNIVFLGLAVALVAVAMVGLRRRYRTVLAPSRDLPANREIRDSGALPSDRG